MSVEAHNESQRLAFEAEQLERRGDLRGARELWANAAQLERTAIANVPTKRAKTRAILAVETVALYQRAGLRRTAAAFAFDYLRDTEAPDWAREKIIDLLSLQGSNPLGDPITQPAVVHSPMASDSEAPPRASVEPTPPGTPGLSRGTFGLYDLQKQIAWGGMGSVWKAVDRATGDDVVVKIAAGSPTTAEALRSEYLASLQIDGSVGIAKVRSWGEEPAPHIVLEYLSGGDLGTTIRRRGRLSSSEAIRLGKTMCSVLAELDRAGMVHRDIKPSNILMRDDGQFVLTDFGLAVPSSRTVVESRTGASFPLTPAYAAPEAWLGWASAASDIYSLGATLYESLVGRPPFAGDYSEQRRHHLDDMPDLDAIPIDAPPALVAAVKWSLAKDLADRPSIQELRACLEKAEFELARTGWALRISVTRRRLSRALAASFGAPIRFWSTFARSGQWVASAISLLLLIACPILLFVFVSEGNGVALAGGLAAALIGAGTDLAGSRLRQSAPRALSLPPLLAAPSYPPGSTVYPPGSTVYPPIPSRPPVAEAVSDEGTARAQATIVTPPDTNPAQLVVMEGGRETVHQLEPGQSLVIGRDPAVTVVLTDPAVSRQHLKVTLLASGWLVTDLGSANGSYLIDSFGRIEALRTPTSLREGRVRIGQTNIKLVSSDVA